MKIGDEGSKLYPVLVRGLGQLSQDQVREVFAGPSHVSLCRLCLGLAVSAYPGRSLPSAGSAWPGRGLPLALCLHLALGLPLALGLLPLASRASALCILRAGALHLACWLCA